MLGQTYRIQRQIGAGGMADVYEVQHLRLGSLFAAKVLRESGSSSAVRRFVREARLLARLKSDHIVTVVDVGALDARPAYYVMELLSGADLRQVLRATPQLTQARAVDIVIDALLGVNVAHSAGIIHRDLKPENVFLTYGDAGVELCKILDFGVVKVKDSSSTQNGALLGTLRYMAPEQIERAASVGPAADVWSLGAILYECLAGVSPHRATGLERLLYEILNSTPSRIRQFRSDVSGELEAIALRALAREPAQRFPNALAFAAALAPFSTRHALARPNSETTLATPTRRVSLGRPRRALRLAGLVATVGIATASLVTYAQSTSANGVTAPASSRPDARVGQRGNDVSSIEASRPTLPPRGGTLSPVVSPRPAAIELAHSAAHLANQATAEPEIAALPRFAVATPNVAATSASSAKASARRLGPASSPGDSESLLLPIKTHNPYDP